MTEADASLGDSLGVSVEAGWLIVLYSLAQTIIGTTSAELQPLELAAVAPPIDILEVGHRARRMADIEPGRRTRLAAFIVVVARRAVGRADHAARTGQQQLDPVVLSLFCHFDFLVTVRLGMPDRQRDCLRCLSQIVRYVGNEIGALRRLDEERVRKAVDVDAVLGAHARGPMVRQLDAATAGQIEAGAPFVFGADFEAGCIDDAIERVFLARDDDAVPGDALDALAVGIDQMRARRVEGLQIRVMKAWPLAKLAIPGFQLRGRLAVADDGIDPGADFLHFLEIGILERRQHLWWGALLARQIQHFCANAPRQMGPAVLHQIFLRGAAGLVRGKILQPALLPAWCRHACKPFRIDRRIGSDIDGGWRALEHVELLAGAREMRHALHGSGAGADDADALVLQLLHQRALGVAAGVVIIPPAGVERMPLEGLDTFDAGKFWHMQRPRPHADELRGEGIAAS